MDAKHSLGEPRLLISRRALLHNARVIRQRLSPATRLCAIVKADAYGHGAAIVADALCHFCDEGSDAPAADALAVASMDEAAALQEALPGMQTPVIVFRPLENAFVGRQRAKIEQAIRAGWVLTLCSSAAAEDVARIAVACGRRAAVQVMIDTGMTRSGVGIAGVDALLSKINARPSLRLVGLCTHFASSEEPHNSFTREQLKHFERATSAYIDHAGGRVHRHAANSGAVFFSPASHLDMVRPGISLYGVDPTGRPHPDRPLRPVMKWTAPIVAIHEVPPGATVGYGQTWTARRPTRVALVPVGYADGYPRSLSNRSSMMVHGHPAPVVGRVSMDMTTLDLTEIPHAAVGDEVTVLDNDPFSPASVYRLAAAADTIPYELFCRIGTRVQRVAIDPVDDAPLPPALDATAAPDPL